MSYWVLFFLSIMINFTITDGIVIEEYIVVGYDWGLF